DEDVVVAGAAVDRAKRMERKIGESVVAAAARQDVDPAAAGKNVIRLRAAGDGVVSARARKLDQIRRRPVGERPGGGRKRSRHRDRDDVLVVVAGEGASV